MNQRVRAFDGPTVRRRANGRGLAAVVWLTLAIACASAPPPPVVTAPRYPAYPALDVPESLGASPRVLEQHDIAWRRFQGGDLRGAARDFSSILKEQPAFYPATAGLGFVELADRDFDGAASRFSAVLERDDRYLPAWIGQAEAQIALNDDRQAIVALERVLAIDPRRETARTRLELVRFRHVQSLIDEGRRARQAGRLDESVRAL
jgi:tetratricopeptide (TPR) repeat protein